MLLAIFSGVPDPEDPVFHNVDNENIDIGERFESIIPLIKNCKKVITYHSMAAVEALCLGKPIEILGQSAVQHWQGKINFDRNEMLEHIAWSQFSRNEFGAGIAWERTFEYQVGQK